MAATKIKLSSIKRNPSNPRVIKDERFEKLMKSIKEFPKMMELRPMVVNDNGVVLGGNMRLKALKELGYKDVPAEWIKNAKELTEDEQRRFIIADNVGFGEHDWEMLSSEWDAEELNEWGLEIQDFEVDEILEAEEDEFEVPDGGIETDIVLGDLFEIGDHRLLCGDSTQTDTFVKLFGEQMADMVVTDPPYNVAYEGKTKEKLTIDNDKQSDGDFYQFLYDFYTAQATVCKMGGAWYVWHASRETINFHKAMSDSGIMPKQDLIWLKSSIVMGRQDYHGSMNLVFMDGKKERHMGGIRTGSKQQY